MPETICCTQCGELDFYLTPSGLMCRGCCTFFSLDICKDIIENYKKESQDIDSKLEGDV